MNTTLFPGERLIVCDPVPLAMMIVNAGRSPAASGRSAREATIDAAGAEYDANAVTLSGLCARESYIDRALRDARLDRLDGRERATLAHSRATAADVPGVRTLAAREPLALSELLGREWDENPGLQRLCTRKAFIEEGLREAERRKLIERAGNEWDSSPEVQRRCGRVEFIDRVLRQA